MPLLALLLLPLLLQAPPVKAAEYRVQIQVVPTIVSGSLTPLVISIDDSIVVQSNDPITSVRVQETTYEKKVHGKATLYKKITGDKISLVLNGEKGAEERHYELPSLLELQFDGKHFHAKTAHTDSITMNGKELTQELSPNELGKVLVFALKKKDLAISRLYNVIVEEIPPAPEIVAKEVPLHLGYCPLDEERRWVHLGVGINLPTRWSLTSYLELELPVYGIWGRVALGARGGYQLFRGTSGTEDPIWLEVGLSFRGVIRYVPSYHIRTSRQTGWTPPNPERGFQLGPYFKTVPLRYGRWGLGLTFEADWVGDLETGSTIMLLELYFHL